MTINGFSTALSGTRQPCVPPPTRSVGSINTRYPSVDAHAASQAALLLCLDPANSAPASQLRLENRSIQHLSPEPTANALSKEERDQIWVMEPTITYDEIRKVNRVVVRKNEKVWAEGHHIDDTIVKNTPKAFIADGTDTEFYDEEGNFICGIIYNIDVKEGAIGELGSLAQATTKRGAGGGLLPDIDKIKQNLESDGATNISISGGWAISYIASGKKRKTTKANSHHSTVYGVSGRRGDGDIAPSKRAGLTVVKPYLELLTDCFKKSFPAQYLDHDKKMRKCQGHVYYQENSVFSTMAVNRHEIDKEGAVKKQSRAALHTDKGHHKDGFEVMLTLKKNIEGGDEFLPEYGILLKLQDRSVTCFKGTAIQHDVTAIGRKDLSKQANRVTALGFMLKLSDAMLTSAKERATSAEAALPPTETNVMPQIGMATHAHSIQGHETPLPAATVLPEPMDPYAFSQEMANLRQALTESQHALQILSLQKELLESRLQNEQLINAELRRQLSLSSQGASPAVGGAFLSMMSPGANTTTTTTSLSDQESRRLKHSRSDCEDADVVVLQSPAKRLRTEKF
ncbi:hypothetical protein [Estrella lausannensis]|uniref:2OGFeDO JBP1/TET oxygenase domain-containing protein n=1 Tax=Estrella lausannensis TaxID=483423 RepID=A0A0H5DP03_9BACT|nr:hypothetical protein [Estrella lausannensis]CRX37593.1 hypothetical protein ELAC_0232 [Estrella lausannensis]